MATPLLSLLSGDEIKSLGLVQGGTDESLYRASTYDLSIGEVIPASHRSAGTQFRLPSGGTVRVISKESLKMPDDITGHALLKNELCRKGVLAINIGVIDPGFEGPLSSILINFGREDFVVNHGDPFLRISFHRCPVSPKAKDSFKFTRKQYISNVKQEVAAYMSPTFLNMEETTRKAAVKAFGSFKKWLFLWAALVAILVALLAIFAPLGASFVEKHIAADNQHETELEQRIETKVVEQYERRLKELSSQVEELKRQEKTRQSSAGGKR